VSSPRHVRPVIVDAQAQGSSNDVEHVVLGVRVHLRSPSARLKPPFRYRVATSRFVAVSLEDRTHPAHRVDATLLGPDDYRLTDRSSFRHRYAPWSKVLILLFGVSAIGRRDPLSSGPASLVGDIQEPALTL